MRVGDFSVEVVPRGKGAVRELDSGHVLARPGQVYALRLRNYGPLRCVADVRLDGEVVTAGGLVLEPLAVEELERPISEEEYGRFTVVGEGNERVFGPDGGRDNPDLGLIEVRFRRELPRDGDRGHPRPLPSIAQRAPSRFDREDMTSIRMSLDAQRGGGSLDRPSPNGRVAGELASSFDAIARPPAFPSVGLPERGLHPDIERAAGSGLTGHSDQRFRAVELGPLEKEATVIQLRLVIGSAEAIAEARPVPERSQSPARPAARP